MLSDDRAIREWANQTDDTRRAIRTYAMKYLEYSSWCHDGYWWPVVRHVCNARNEVIGKVVRLRWYRKVNGEVA